MILKKLVHNTKLNIMLYDTIDAFFALGFVDFSTLCDVFISSN